MKNKGFLTIEYVVLTAVVVAALLAMFVYLKRGICGNWRDSADTFSFGRQGIPP